VVSAPGGSLDAADGKEGGKRSTGPNGIARGRGNAGNEGKNKKVSREVGILQHQNINKLPGDPPDVAFDIAAPTALTPASPASPEPLQPPSSPRHSASPLQRPQRCRRIPLFQAAPLGFGAAVIRRGREPLLQPRQPPSLGI
jgi:hypothetical protein